MAAGTYRANCSPAVPRAARGSISSRALPSLSCSFSSISRTGLFICFAATITRAWRSEEREEESVTESEWCVRSQVGSLKRWLEAILQNCRSFKKVFDINEIAVKSRLLDKDRSEALRRKEIPLLPAPEMKIFQNEDHPRRNEDVSDAR